MKAFHDKTCIRLRPRTNEKHFVNIYRGSGCSSIVGRDFWRQGTGQPLSLGQGCVNLGIVIHELMHAAGFYHEQSRSDRDDFVIIKDENIMPGKANNFKKFEQDEITHLGADYDLCSIMHYGRYAFSKNRKVTIVPRITPECKMGQRSGFSDTDIRKLNTMYKCEGYPQVVTGSTSTPKPTTITSATSTTIKPTSTVKPTTTNTTPATTKPPSTSTTTQTPSTTESTCVDNSPWCDYHALNGGCQSSPTYMAAYCAATCNLCGQTCEDKYWDCYKWAQQGFCKGQYENAMHENCKLSCNYC
eukprot:TRINITY_DN8983_c0_g1_i1.p1 TRINITY_DN8983_c0_g1~~TRINITY_DN8983_c0_g1_i1.p1  ORF type:complete len:301 (-),score=36.37 TRINITY_DN8983_c0_g1_i1:25-927(-)